MKLYKAWSETLHKMKVFFLTLVILQLNLLKNTPPSGRHMFSHNFSFFLNFDECWYNYILIPKKSFIFLL